MTGPPFDVIGKQGNGVREKIGIDLTGLAALGHCNVGDAAVSDALLIFFWDA